MRDVWNLQVLVLTIILDDLIVIGDNYLLLLMNNDNDGHKFERLSAKTVAKAVVYGGKIELTLICEM